MGRPRPCVVGGCDSTSDTHQLFHFPKIDSVRNLWLYFVVPTNPLLIGLTKDQLTSKCICKKHFDKYQFDVEGKRLRFGYPCLFTDEEISGGEPRPARGTVHNALSDHNYYKNQEDQDDEDNLRVLELETPKHEEQDLQDPLSIVERTGFSPTKPAVPEQIKPEPQQKFEILINDNYEIFIQEYNENKVNESPHDGSREIIENKVSEHNYSATLPEQDGDNEPASPMKEESMHSENEDEEPILPMVDEFMLSEDEDREPISPMSDELTQSVSQQNPLGLKNKKLKIAVKKLKILNAEVLRQRKIIKSLKEKLRKANDAPPSLSNFDKQKCLDIVTKNMTECGKIFTRMQYSQSHLRPHARRFNMKEKVLSLTIYKTSPRCYRLLSKFFVMPSIKALSRLLSEYKLKGDQNKVNEE